MPKEKPRPLGVAVGEAFCVCLLSVSSRHPDSLSAWLERAGRTQARRPRLELRVMEAFPQEGFVGIPVLLSVRLACTSSCHYSAFLYQRTL